MVVLVLLAGCTGAPPPEAGNVYRITAREAGQIPFRMLDGVNELRSASGLGALSLNSSAERRRTDPFARYGPAKPALALWL